MKQNTKKTFESPKIVLLCFSDDRIIAASIIADDGIGVLTDTAEYKIYNADTVRTIISKR